MRREPSFIELATRALIDERDEARAVVTDLRRQLAALEAERDEARAMLAKVEAALPALYSQRQKPLDVRVKDLIENRDKWYMCALDFMEACDIKRAEVAHLLASVAELVAERDGWERQAKTAARDRNFAQATRDMALGLLDRIDAALPTPASTQRPTDRPSLVDRVARIRASRDMWASEAATALEERNQAQEKVAVLQARVAELEAERVPGNRREFQASLDAMQEIGPDIIPPRPIGAESLARMDEMRATVPSVQVLPVTGSVTVEAPEHVIVHKETER